MDYLEQFKEKISEANRIWREEIEIENAALLRVQISRTFLCVPDMATLASKAEREYRLLKMEVVKRVPGDFKGDARRVWIEGETSGLRYQRDILDTLHRGLINKISAQKSILASLIQEMKDVGLDE
jgi:hypothetical protein